MCSHLPSSRIHSKSSAGNDLFGPGYEDMSPVKKAPSLHGTSTIDVRDPSRKPVI
jgi:hypothetical protein